MSNSGDYQRRVGLFLHKNKQSVITILILSIIADILFWGDSSDLRIFPILILYIFCTVFYKLTDRTTFLISFLILGLMSTIYIISGPSVNAEKAAVWLFFLLLIGVFQQFKK